MIGWPLLVSLLIAALLVGLWVVGAPAREVERAAALTTTWAVPAKEPGPADMWGAALSAGVRPPGWVGVAVPFVAGSWPVLTR